MIRSYDFLKKAYRVPSFRNEILRHIHLTTNSEMVYEYAILKFDYENKVIREYPNPGALLSCKVFPMELSYDAFLQMMSSEDPWTFFENECRFLD